MRTWVRNGAPAVLLAAGACAFGARGVCADTPSTERFLAPGELAMAPSAVPVSSVESERALTVLGGALPGLPAPGLRAGGSGEPAGAAAAPAGLPAPGGPVRVMLACSALTLVVAAGVLLTGRIRGA